MRMLKTDPVVNKRRRRGLKRNGRTLDAIGGIGRGLQRVAGTVSGVGLAVPASLMGGYAGAVVGGHQSQYGNLKKGNYGRAVFGLDALKAEYQGAKRGFKQGATGGYKLGRQLWGLNRRVQNSRNVKMLITD